MFLLEFLRIVAHKIPHAAKKKNNPSTIIILKIVTTIRNCKEKRV